MDDLTRTIDSWINALELDTFDELCAKPAPDSWSLGQVYMHIIETTGYFIKQAKICLSTDAHATDVMSVAAETMLTCICAITSGRKAGLTPS